MTEPVEKKSLGEPTEDPTEDAKEQNPGQQGEREQAKAEGLSDPEADSDLAPEQDLESAPETASDDDKTDSGQSVPGVEDSACLAVLHMGGLSDVLQSSALAQSVRLAWPEARILLVTTEDAAPLAKGLGFDEGLVLQRSGSQKGLGGIDSMVSRLRSADVRALLVVSPSLRSAILAWRSKIFMRVAWSGRTDVPLGGMLERLAYTHKLPSGVPGQNRADEIQQLLQPLQIPIAARFPRFRPRVADKTWVTDFLAEQNIDKQRLVSLVPASTKPAKRWPLMHWVQLIDALVEKKFQPLLIAGERDRAYCEQIRSECRRPLAVHRAIGCNLEQSAELMRRSLLTIGVDTGLSHLGLAAGAKGLLLFGPSLASHYALQGRAKSLKVAVECRPCKLGDDGECPLEGHACMTGIEASRVLRQALKLMRKP